MQTSSKVVGVDGCRAGWFAVVLEGEAWQTHLYATILALWRAQQDAARILIDIPIGLPERRERACDGAARQVLGVRRSSVFSVPVREAVYAPTYAQANAVNEQAVGKKLSKQSWNITPKIREVDLLLFSEHPAREVLYETHPEVLFWALNGGQPMAHAKRRRVDLRFVGLNERLALLQAYFPQASALYEDALRRYPRRQLGRDDVVDALAAAVAARMTPHATLPPQPERDVHDLPMQIVYPAQPAVK